MTSADRFVIVTPMSRQRHTLFTGTREAEREAEGPFRPSVMLADGVSLVVARRDDRRFWHDVGLAVHVLLAAAHILFITAHRCLTSRWWAQHPNR